MSEKDDGIISYILPRISRTVTFINWFPTKVSVLDGIKFIKLLFKRVILYILRTVTNPRNLYAKTAKQLELLMQFFHL